MTATRLPGTMPAIAARERPDSLEELGVAEVEEGMEEVEGAEVAVVAAVAMRVVLYR